MGSLSGIPEPRPPGAGCCGCCGRVFVPAGLGLLFRSRWHPRRGRCQRAGLAFLSISSPAAVFSIGRVSGLPLLVGGPTPTRLIKHQAPVCAAQGCARLRLGGWTPRPRAGSQWDNLLTQACALWGPGGLGREPQHREIPWGSRQGQPSHCGDHGLCQGGSLRL